MKSRVGEMESVSPLWTQNEKTRKWAEDVKVTAAPGQPEEEQSLFLDVARENESLRRVNEELLERVKELGQRVSAARVQPIRIEASPEQTARISRLESEKERLLVQLREKAEQLAEARLQLGGRGETRGTEALELSLRKEIGAQLREEFDGRARRAEEEAETLRRALDEKALEVASRDREIEILERNLKGLEKQTLGELEEMRRRVGEAMWDEYEKKLGARKEEFEKRCEVSMGEIEKLSAAVKEWRRRCFETEEKMSELQAMLHSSEDSDLDLKRMVANYESRVLGLEKSLDKSGQVAEDLKHQVEVGKERLRLANEDLEKVEERRQKAEKSLVEWEAQGKALLKDNERVKAQSASLVGHVEKVEGENAKLRIKLLELEGTVKAYSSYKDTDSKELVWERANGERLNGEVLSLQTSLKAANGRVAMLEGELERLNEEILVKNGLISEMKRSNKSMSDGYEELMKENAETKAGNWREGEKVRMLEEEVKRLVVERKEMFIQVDREKGRQVGSLAGRDAEHENIILRKKVEDYEGELKAARAKLGQMSSRSMEIIEEGRKLAQQYMDMSEKVQEQKDTIKDLSSEIMQLKLAKKEGGEDEKLNSVLVENAVIKAQLEELRKKYDSMKEKTKEQLTSAESKALYESIGKLVKDNENLSSQISTSKAEFGAVLSQLKSKPGNEAQDEQIKLLSNMINMLQQDKEALVISNQKLAREFERSKNASNVSPQYPPDDIAASLPPGFLTNQPATFHNGSQQDIQRLIDENNFLRMMNQQKGSIHGYQDSGISEPMADERLQDAQEKILTLQNYINTLGDELEKKTKLLEDMKNGGVESAINKLAKENDNLRAHVSKLNLELTSLTKERQLLLDEVSVLRNDNTSLSKQIQNIMKEKSERIVGKSPSDRMEKQASDSAFKEIDEKNRDLSEKVNTLIQQNRELNDKNVELQKMVHSFNG